jgi:two-component system cell cycle response regulator
MGTVAASAAALRDGAERVGLPALVAMTSELVDAAESAADPEQVRQAVDALHEAVPTLIKGHVPAGLKSVNSEQLTAVVADDSSTLRHLHADALTAAGYDVRTARDGSSALRQLESSVPDVVVTDFDMAPMNGPELIRAMAADERFAQTPVILVSARAPDEVREAIGDLKVAAVIGKSELEKDRLADAANEACSAAPQRETGGRAGRILVAEDSKMLRVVLCDQLVAAGYEVIQADDGEKAVELAKALNPDVALLDREMPKLDGFGALAALQGDPVTADLPVVFVTGRVSPEELAEGLDLGAHDYVRKPVQTAELLARIRTAMRMRALHTELAMRNEELEAMAQTDVLTGLTNRRHAAALMAGAIGTASRHHRELCVVMVDVDHFKAVNDTHGHGGGDEVLRSVAETMRRTLRAEDIAARWGGEEFLLILPDIGRAGAERAAERLRSALSADPIVCNGNLVPVTASFGVAEFTGEEDPETLIARADSALYDAKEGGRDRVCFTVAA